MRRPVLSLALGLLLATPAAAEDVVEPRTGRTYPRQDLGMSLASVGVRTKLFVKVYAAGFYVEPEGAREVLSEFRGLSHEELVSSERFYAALVGDGFAKAMVMQFVYNAGAKKVQGAFREGIEENLPGTSPAADAFLALFTGEVGNKGDRLTIRTSPGGKIVVLSHGAELGTVEDAALSEAVWKIWLGPEPILPKLKSGLVELLPEVLR